ncbi:hypothetical protein V5799_027036 [Amblyomma americanum]|uniref:Uncharacterized protein n=1 Tax=Amblyomma americanum TaxID=6943 RepID=A0AAQ4DGV7_AMBAM
MYFVEHAKINLLPYYSPLPLTKNLNLNLTTSDKFSFSWLEQPSCGSENERKHLVKSIKLMKNISAGEGGEFVLAISLTAVDRAELW